jgi:hypothetical protein
MSDMSERSKGFVKSGVARDGVEDERNVLETGKPRWRSAFIASFLTGDDETQRDETNPVGLRFDRMTANE